MFLSVRKVPVVQLSNTNRNKKTPPQNQNGQIISNSFHCGSRSVGKEHTNKQVGVVGRYVFAFPSSVCFVRSKDCFFFIIIFLFFNFSREFCAREEDLALPQALGAQAIQEPKSSPAEPRAHRASFAGISTLLCQSQFQTSVSSVQLLR